MVSPVPMGENLTDPAAPIESKYKARRPWTQWFLELLAAVNDAATSADVTALTATVTAVSGTVTTLSGTVATLAATVAAIGDWTLVAFSAGDFTANGGMTWTVGSGDVQRHAYAKFGDTMVLAVSLTSTTVGGALNTDLRVAIPGGFTATGNASVTGYGFDNGGGGILTRVSVTAGAAFVTIQLSTPAVSWQASGNATDIAFTFPFEVA